GGAPAASPGGTERTTTTTSTEVSKPGPTECSVGPGFFVPRRISQRYKGSLNRGSVRMSTGIPSRDDPPARSGRGSGACNHPLHTSGIAPGSRPVLGVDGGESPLVPPELDYDTPTEGYRRYLRTHRIVPRGVESGWWRDGGLRLVNARACGRVGVCVDSADRCQSRVAGWAHDEHPLGL